MTITGIQTCTVHVDVTPQELFRGLCQQAGLGAVFQKDNEFFWKEILEPNGELVTLQEMHDISYHGSPVYRETGKAIRDPAKLSLYQHLKAVQKLMAI